MRLLVLNCDTSYNRWFKPKVHSKFIPNDMMTIYNCRSNEFPDISDIKSFDILFIPGSDYSVNEEEKWYKILIEIIQISYESNLKIFGFCFGHQIIGKALGAKVSTLTNGYIGLESLALNKIGKKLLKTEFLLSYSYHNDYLNNIDGSPLLKLSKFNNNLCIIINKKNEIVGLTYQLHPEFSFDLDRHDDIFTDQKRKKYINFNDNIKRDFNKCLEGDCNHLSSINIPLALSHYYNIRYNKDNIWYMYRSSIYLRKLIKKIIHNTLVINSNINK